MERESERWVRTNKKRVKDGFGQRKREKKKEMGIGQRKKKEKTDKTQ